MPNHVTTILQADPKVLHSLNGKEGAVDFNSVIPYPSELEELTAEYEVFDTEAEVRAHCATKDAFYSKIGEFGKSYIGKKHAITQEEYEELVSNYGVALDWYNWRIRNWGTKWNAYSIETEINESQRALLNNDGPIVKFDTAWSHPSSVISALSKRFPDETLYVLYADEDTGHNYGKYSIKNGEYVEGIPEHLGHGQEALDFASIVRYGITYEELTKEWEDDED